MHRLLSNLVSSLGPPAWLKSNRLLVIARIALRSPGCYSRGGPYFIFSIFLSQLYAPLSFLLQWLCRYSFPGLSQRSRHPDLDLQYNFLLWQTIPFLHTSLYSMAVSPIFPSLANPSTFLVRSPIVLSLRKVPYGLVYKTALVFSFSLASSAHHLLSNLVSHP